MPIQHLTSLIGNTPLLEISCFIDKIDYTIYAKYEQANMTGSIKDRMVLYILDQGYKNGGLKSGDTIVEASSGNTGISGSGRAQCR